jgi:hypothetical protein
MTAVLIDSNVLLDLMTEDPRWFAWSAAAVARVAERFRLVINPIIYGEVSVRYSQIEDLDAALPKSHVRPGGNPISVRLSGREGVSALSSARGHETIAATRFLYRCPRRGRRLSIADARCDPLSHVFSETAVDHPD